MLSSSDSVLSAGAGDAAAAAAGRLPLGRRGAPDSAARRSGLSPSAPPSAERRGSSGRAKRQQRLKREHLQRPQAALLTPVPLTSAGRARARAHGGAAHCWPRRRARRHAGLRRLNEAFRRLRHHLPGQQKGLSRLHLRAVVAGRQGVSSARARSRSTPRINMSAAQPGPDPIPPLLQATHQQILLLLCLIRRRAAGRRAAADQQPRGRVAALLRHQLLQRFQQGNGLPAPLTAQPVVVLVLRQTVDLWVGGWVGGTGEQHVGRVATAAGGAGCRGAAVPAGPPALPARPPAPPRACCSDRAGQERARSATISTPRYVLRMQSSLPCSKAAGAWTEAGGQALLLHEVACRHAQPPADPSAALPQPASGPTRAPAPGSGPPASRAQWPPPPPPRCSTGRPPRTPPSRVALPVPLAAPARVGRSGEEWAESGEGATEGMGAGAGAAMQATQASVSGTAAPANACRTFAADTEQQSRRSSSALSSSASR